MVMKLKKVNIVGSVVLRNEEKSKADAGEATPIMKVIKVRKNMMQIVLIAHPLYSFYHLYYTLDLRV